MNQHFTRNIYYYPIYYINYHYIFWTVYNDLTISALPGTCKSLCKRVTVLKNYFVGHVTSCYPPKSVFMIETKSAQMMLLEVKCSMSSLSALKIPLAEKIWTLGKTFISWQLEEQSNYYPLVMEKARETVTLSLWLLHYHNYHMTIVCHYSSRNNCILVPYSLPWGLLVSLLLVCFTLINIMHVEWNL